jgi:hypothetical protein
MIDRSQHTGVQPSSTISDISDFRKVADEDNRIFLSLGEISLVGSGAAVRRIVAPIAGTITAIRSVLNGALTSGNATLTAKIGSTAVTGGVVTITQASSAADDVDSAAPTAANTVAVGSVISLTVGGTNDANVTASALIEITPSA